MSSCFHECLKNNDKNKTRVTLVLFCRLIELCDDVQTTSEAWTTWKFRILWDLWLIGSRSLNGAALGAWLGLHCIGTGLGPLQDTGIFSERYPGSRTVDERKCNVVYKSTSKLIISSKCRNFVQTLWQYKLSECLLTFYYMISFYVLCM